MSTENLTQTVEVIAMALSEPEGYEYYHVNDMLKELAKGVADMQAENTKLRDERDYMYKASVEKNGEILNLLIEAARRRELIRCFVNAENPSDRAKLIADAADVLEEMGVKVPS